LAGPNVVAIAPSRDATRVAVVSRVNDGSELQVIDTRDASSVVAFESEKVLTSPAWRADTTEVTVVQNDRDGRADLLRVVVDGALSRHAPIEIVDGRHSLAEPDWSADGRWLAIEGQPLDELRGMTVYLQDQTTGTTLLLDPSDAPEPKCACARFAPSGSRLCYTYTLVGAMESEIRVFDPAVGERTTLSTGGLNDPRWSSDGDSLLAARHVSICESHLVRVEVATGEVHEVCAPPGQHLSPVHLDRRSATYIARSCEGVAEVPTRAGVLWSLDLRSGALTEVAHETSLAVVI
jgi:Tol biopolymer transport system component